MARAERFEAVSPAPARYLAAVLAGGGLPLLIGAALPSSRWAVAAAALVAGLAGAIALLQREEDDGLRRTMGLAAGASLTALAILVSGAALWPPEAAANRAALCALAAAGGFAFPCLSFEWQRLEWWYVVPALLAVAALLMAAWQVIQPLVAAAV